MVQRHRDSVPLPVIQPDASRSRMGRRRAIALIVVHLIVAAHLLHYYLAGSTVSPIEPSEAGHSLRDGAINAGAIFLVVAILSTLLLGRFFCGWACHLVAYQDLTRWILLRLGIRPRPLRSRLLLFAPLFAAYWLFGKPLVDRWIAGEPAPGVSWRLTTDEFWATFPGPAMTLLTFVVCGGLIVLLVGAKGFCTFGCPYGALFVVTDRFARGRIRVNDDCDGTAECTRNCSSNVDVAGEVARYGMVVDPGCMKCLDCVAGCPNDALRFGLGSSRPTVPRRHRAPRALAWLWSPATLLAALVVGLLGLTFRAGWELGVGLSLLLAIAMAGWRLSGRGGPDASRGGDRGDHLALEEELLLVGVFVASFAVLFDLYRVIPLLLAIGLAVIVAGLTRVAIETLATREASLQGVALRAASGPRPAGIGVLVVVAIVWAVIGHSAFVQWHTRAALDDFRAAQELRWGDDARWKIASRHAGSHLATVSDHGWMHTRGLGRMVGELRRWTGEPDQALSWYAVDREHGSRNPELPILEGLAMIELARLDEGRTLLDSALVDRFVSPSRYRQVAWELRQLGDRDTRLDVLEAGARWHPADATLAFELCTDLVRHPDPGRRDPVRALDLARRVADEDGRRHPELLGLLAWLWSEQGNLAQAAQAASDSARAARELGELDLAADMEAMAEHYRATSLTGGGSPD